MKKEDHAPELRVTDDGSHTLYIRGMDEHYHSHFGAFTESTHIFINAGYRYCTADPVRILEIGFGTGLNALLTAIEAGEHKRETHYLTVEKYPLPEAITAELNYGKLTGTDGERLFRLIHAAPWDMAVKINEYFTLEKRMTDITTGNISGVYDLIYFDAFGPDKQPEMWSDDIFSLMAEASAPGTVFVTYSAKGALKRMLRSKGFETTQLPGPPGKRCITRAVKKTEQ